MANFLKEKTHERYFRVPEDDGPVTCIDFVVSPEIISDYCAKIGYQEVEEITEYEFLAAFRKAVRQTAKEAGATNFAQSSFDTLQEDSND